MSTHSDPTRAEFGFVAEPRDFFFRSLEAKERTAFGRSSDALHLANMTIGPESEAWAVPIAAGSYRKSVAADEYACAVYDVEAEKVRAR